MRTSPISFTEDNFCSILAGNKTETRRLLTIKGRTQEYVNEIEAFHKDEDGEWIAVSGLDANNPEWVKKAYPKGSNKGIKPKYNVGDRCYLTEPTQILNTTPDDSIYIESCEVAYFWSNKTNTFEGISDRKWVELTDSDSTKICNRKSGIYSKQIARFMLKSFARYWVEIVDVRLERLLDITEEAAIAEGIKCHVNRGYLDGNLNYEYPLYWDYTTNQYSFKSPITSYLSEIAAIHKPTKDKIGGYELVDSNPWVWVYKFKLVGENQ